VFEPFFRVFVAPFQAGFRELFKVAEGVPPYFEREFESRSERFLFYLVPVSFLSSVR